MIKHSDVFCGWDYSGAVAVDGLWKANQSFGIPFENQLNDYLQKYVTDKESYGYKILHGIGVPFGEAIGDTVGLFPIAYLNRALAYSGVKPGYENTTDMRIAQTVAEEYIMSWPKRLPDGTFSRNVGWDGQKGTNSFVWADDQFMGLTLIARLAAVNKDVVLASTAALQAIYFARHLKNSVDGLFHHGYNDRNGIQSCCKWGRANGWAMISHVEVLTSLASFHPDEGCPLHDLYQQVLSMFQSHSKAVADVQSADGRWHQVLNETSTYLETTSTAMFISSIARGVHNNWLNSTRYSPVLDRGWTGLNAVVREDGTVSGACIGTGIMTSVEEYQERPTAYLNPNSGVGSVLLAAADYHSVKYRGY